MRSPAPHRRVRRSHSDDVRGFLLRCARLRLCAIMTVMLLKRWLVGDPLKSTQAPHERLSKNLALAIFSSNAISSVAYATEEILMVLVLAVTAAIAWSIPISFAILFH